MKSFKKILLVALSAMMVLSLVSCSQPAADNKASDAAKTEDSSKPAKKGEFVVGLECGYPPFNWTQDSNANGAVAIKDSKDFAGGYDIEIAKKIADGLGKELVVVKTEWDGLPPALQSKMIDGIIAGMSPTAERKETIDFSDHYYRSDLVIIVKAGSKYENAKSIQDFAGAKITGQLNTFHYGVIDQIKGVDKQTAMDNFPSMRVALEAGTIDGYIAERPEGISITASRGDTFKMVEFEKGQGFEASDDDVAIAVGLRKEDTKLKEDINKILAGISEQERQKIMDTAIKNQPAAEEE